MGIICDLTLAKNCDILHLCTSLLFSTDSHGLVRVENWIFEVPLSKSFLALESNPLFLLMLSLAIAPSHPSPVAAEQPEPPTPPQPLAATEP